MNKYIKAEYEHTAKKNNFKNVLSKIDKRNFLFAIPIFILLLISTFQIAYFYFESSITNRIIDTMSYGNITEDTITLIREFINTYSNQYFSLGLEIIGIAISIWIGLNIYNIVKRDSIKELETVAKKTQHDLNEFSNNYKQFNITAIENAHVPEDRINDYFLERFTKTNANILDYKLTKYIVFFERSFERVIDSYNNENYDLMKKHLEKLKIEIQSFQSDIQLKYPSLEQDSIQLIEAYISCRKGDYHYYCGLYYKSQKIFTLSSNELKISQENYSSKVLIKITEDEVIQYLNNVQGYIYQLLQSMTKDNQEKQEFIELAYKFSRDACIDKNDHEIKHGYSRSYRNFGVNIENYIKLNSTGDMYIKGLFQAYQQYLLAYKYNKYDIKTLTSLSSCILKIFDYIIQISSDTSNVYKKLSEVNLKQIDITLNRIGINYAFAELLDAAKIYLQTAALVDGTKIAIHYHLIHVYMYLYLLKKSDTYIDKGRSEIENCLALSYKNQLPLAFKYKARNFYFAIEDFENANKYEQMIKNQRNSILTP